MNRFANKNDQSSLRRLPRIRLTYFLCPALLALFLLGLSSIGETTVSRQQESLENALNRDIIHCYAVEGFYPPSLEYIEEHYGLVYDKNMFFVDYQPIASNLRPDVTILLRQ